MSSHYHYFDYSARYSWGILVPLAPWSHTKRRPWGCVHKEGTGTDKSTKVLTQEKPQSHFLLPRPAVKIVIIFMSFTSAAGLQLSCSSCQNSLILQHVPTTNYWLCWGFCLLFRVLQKQTWNNKFQCAAIQKPLVLQHVHTINLWLCKGSRWVFKVLQKLRIMNFRIQLSKYRFQYSAISQVHLVRWDFMQAAFPCQNVNTCIGSVSCTGS